MDLHLPTPYDGFNSYHNEWLTRDPFREYEIKREETTRGFLTKDEIRQLMDGKLKNAKQELYRDLFVFCIFTFVALTNVCLIINKLQTNNRGIGNGLETTCLHHFA